MKIYVGNLSYQSTEQDLRKEFEGYGQVGTISMITDRDTGTPKGFAFIEMASVSEGRAAISGINGKTLNERTIVVNEARARTDTRTSGSYGNRRDSGYGKGRPSRY